MSVGPKAILASGLAPKVVVTPVILGAVWA